MEVMFAVLILALGLVFVACQFPVALSVCRDVVDNTREVVESHNSQIMIELKLREVHGDMSVDKRPAIFDPGNLHVLLKPNILVDSLDVVVDDLEIDVTGYNYIGYLIDTGQYNIADIDLPFWSHDSTNILDYQDLTDYYFGDIGYAMSPPVDESDSKVQLMMYNTGFIPGTPRYIVTLNRVIFDVSMERKYSWCAFYREPGNNYNSIEYYIVTLRNSSRETRYAIQSTNSFVFTDTTDPLYTGRPPYLTIDNMVGPANQDRLFPVPWRVFLSNDTIDNYTQYYWGNSPDGLIPADQKQPAVFPVRPEIGMMLRTGSILIDADPPDLGNPFAEYGRVAGGSGNIYEVAKVEWDDSISMYWITLRTSLADDDLFSFWFFPPPVIRDGGPIRFDDFQPVVNVTKKIIKFD